MGYLPSIHDVEEWKILNHIGGGGIHRPADADIAVVVARREWNVVHLHFNEMDAGLQGEEEILVPGKDRRNRFRLLVLDREADKSGAQGLQDVNFEMNG